MLYQEAGLFFSTCKKGLWGRVGKEKQGQLHNCTQVSLWVTLLYKLLSLCHNTSPASTLTCSRAFCPLCGILYSRWYEVKNTSRNGCTFNWVLFNTSDTCSNWVMYCQCVSCMYKIFMILVLQQDAFPSKNFSRLQDWHSWLELLAHMLPYVRFNCKVFLPRMTRLCQHRTDSVQKS